MSHSRRLLLPLPALLFACVDAELVVKASDESFSASSDDSHAAATILEPMFDGVISESTESLQLSAEDLELEQIEHARETEERERSWARRFSVDPGARVHIVEAFRQSDQGFEMNTSDDRYWHRSNWRTVAVHSGGPVPAEFTLLQPAGVYEQLSDCGSLDAPEGALRLLLVEAVEADDAGASRYRVLSDETGRLAYATPLAATGEHTHRWNQGPDTSVQTVVMEVASW